MAIGHITPSAKQQIISEIARELSDRRSVPLRTEQGDRRITLLQQGYDFLVAEMPDDYIPKVY